MKGRDWAGDTVHTRCICLNSGLPGGLSFPQEEGRAPPGMRVAEGRGLRQLLFGEVRA